MLDAILNGSHTMAQFNIPELGGSGQWMQGGMTMVGDMFNSGLKTTVNNLCHDLSVLINQQDIFVKSEASTRGNGGYSSSWWPSEWGAPSSSGSQNNMRYAYFSAINRLALNNQGNITTYDTLHHQISGFSQQQGNSQSVVFTSQFGTVDVRQLPLINGDVPKTATPTPERIEETIVVEEPVHRSIPSNSPTRDDSSDIFNKIERLSELYKKGILNEAEFNAKKKELLERL